MKNIFDEVDLSKSSIKMQQPVSDGSIGKKVTGRPKRPNMVKKIIKVDRYLYKRLAKRAEEEDTTIAAIISRALKRDLAN